MIVCLKCGTRNRDESEWCAKCGTFLEFDGERVVTESGEVAAPAAAPERRGVVRRIKDALSKKNS